MAEFTIRTEQARWLKWEWQIGGGGVASGYAPFRWLAKALAERRIGQWKYQERRAERERARRERTATEFRIPRT